QAIRQLRNADGCCIVGWSFGGVLALETARQLQRLGADVGLLVIIDAHASLCGRPDRPTPSLYSDFVADLRRQLGQERDHIGTLLDREIRAYRAHYRALQLYRPQAYEGPALVMRTSQGTGPDQEDPLLGWKNWLRGETMSETIDG